MMPERGSARVDVLRGGTIESRHEVDFAFAAFGDEDLEVDEPVFLRSSAKPFQAAAIVRSGAAERFRLTEEEIAIVAASHSGEDRHTTIVAALLEKLGVTESSLRCGVHPPFDAATAARLGGRASQIHHNCSGKHAGMIALALYLGVPAGCYLDPDGIVQQTMRATVALACGLDAGDVLTAIDGCSALTFAVPLAAGARAFAALAAPKHAPAEIAEALDRVAAAMAAHPELVGGTGRFDTRLMSAAAPRLLSKAGAEGVQGVGDRATGRGLCVKVRDGTARAVGPATIEALRRAEWVDDGAVLDALRDEWRPPIVNFTGKRVGEIVASVTSRPRGRGRPNAG